MATFGISISIGTIWVALMILNLVGTVASMIEMGQPVNAQPCLQPMMDRAVGPVDLFIYSLCSALSAITILGSVQMIRRRTWGFALAACVISIVNFGNGCCLFGLPFGIWGLTTLTNPEVREGFS